MLGGRRGVGGRRGIEVDLLDPGRLGEEFDDAWLVGGEPLVVGKREQHVRRLASVGDVDGAVRHALTRDPLEQILVWLGPSPDSGALAGRRYPLWG